MDIGWLEQLLELQKKAQAMQGNWPNQFTNIMEQFNKGFGGVKEEQPKTQPQDVEALEKVWSAPVTKPASDSEPLLTIMENHNDISVTGFLPGIKSREDISIKLIDNTLHIEGKSTKFSFAKKGVLGAFNRSIKLPADVDVQGATAHYSNGYLQIRLKKKEHIIHNIDIVFR